MEKTKRHCLECGKELIGRIDKKFCNDYCRNAYNNKLNSNDSNLMRNINNALRKNRRILMKLNPNGKSKTTKSKLLESGFDFKYHTSIYTTKKGNTYYFVYEYGYLELENDFFALVVNDKY